MGCKHYINFLEKEHRHYIDAQEFNNCVLCLSEKKGPMKQKDIAKYLGLTKMCVCQIERRALKKVRHKLYKFYNFGKEEFYYDS